MCLSISLAETLFLLLENIQIVKNQVLVDIEELKNIVFFKEFNPLPHKLPTYLPLVDSHHNFDFS